MKWPVPENLFELEPLEQRILLSGDSLLGALPTGIPDKADDLFAADLALLPSEEVPLSTKDDVQETSSLYSNPYNPADTIDDLFAGLTEESLSTEGEEEGILKEALDSESVADESSQSVFKNHEITPEGESAIKEGLEEMAHVDKLLETCNEFTTPVPIHARRQCW